MSTVLEWLQEQLGNISEGEIDPPTGELEDGERVVGTLESTEARKVFEFRNRVTREMSGLVKEDVEMRSHGQEEGSDDHDPATCELCRIGRRLELLKEKKEMLDKLFWCSVLQDLSEEAHIEFREMGYDGVGIRKDWQIVFFKQENPSGLGDMLRMAADVFS